MIQRWSEHCKFYFKMNSFCFANSWDAHDAHVVCRQLGSFGGVTCKQARFGLSRAHFYVIDVNCLGNETNLADCPANEQSSLGFYRDVSVVCGMWYALHSKIVHI